MADGLMKDLMNFYNKQEDIRVFAMNGSRVNVNIPPDGYRDYDVVFFTDDVGKYKQDASFLSHFGDVLMVTEPEADGPNLYPDGNGYTYLVLYQDGNRIDFQIMALSLLERYLSSDSLTQIIADKDGRIEGTIEPSDRDYWIGEPSEELVTSSIKEFWWQSTNVLKATLRGELLLSQFYLNLTRDELIRLMTWVVATEYGFDRNYGKKSTQILRYLSDADRQALLNTFNTVSEKTIYDSLKKMMKLEERFMAMISNQSDFYTGSSLDDYGQVPLQFLESKNEKELAGYFSDRIFC